MRTIRQAQYDWVLDKLEPAMPMPSQNEESYLALLSVVNSITGLNIARGDITSVLRMRSITDEQMEQINSAILLLTHT